MKLQRLCLCWICALFVACTAEDKPPNLIEDDVYIDLLVEMQIIKSHSYIEPGLKVDSLRMEVLDYYGVTKAEFLQSHAFYQSEGEVQVERIEEAIERLRTLEGKLLQQAGE